MLRLTESQRETDGVDASVVSCLSRSDFSTSTCFPCFCPLPNRSTEIQKSLTPHTERDYDCRLLVVATRIATQRNAASDAPMRTAVLFAEPPLTTTGTLN